MIATINSSEVIALANTIALAVIGVFTYLNNRHASVIVSKVAEVKTIVDGPLSLALRSNADLASRLAEATGLHTDAVTATKAQNISDNRTAGKLEPPVASQEPK